MMVSLSDEAAGICGLNLTVNFEAVTPSTAPPLQWVGLDKGLLSSAFTDSIYAGVGVIDPDTTLPYDNRRRVALVHGDSVDGPADVMRLPFKLPPSAPPGAVYTVSVTTEAFDESGRKVALDGAVGTLTVAGFPPGDVDGSGQTDVRDAILILRCTVGLDTLTAGEEGRADVDGSESVDVSDAVGVLRLVVGLGG